MKKLISMIACLLFIAVPSYATVQGGNDNDAVAISGAMSKAQAEATASSKSSSTSSSQTGSSSAQTGASTSQSGGSTSSVKIDSKSAVIIPPEINPMNIPILQNGRIGDMTAAMPLFADISLTPLGKNDRIVEVLDIYTGNLFSRITYDEVESYLISKAKKYAGKKNVRYSVKFQDSAISSGVGGGLAGSLTSSNGLDASTGVGAILPGVHRSTANPVFIITFYRVQ